MERNRRWAWRRNPPPAPDAWGSGVDAERPAWNVPYWTPPPPATPAPLGPLHSRRHILLAGSLFLLTAGSTFITWGAAYAAAIMVILLSHEMGHYVMCRRYRVRTTLPLFIPMPLISPFGTMGAVILMRQPRRERRALFDIGIAGPLAGLVPSVIAVAWGLAHSTPVAIVPEGFGGLRLGDSLLFSGFQKLFHPGLPQGTELMLHPVAYAGWAGFFVTALNLMPIGQLDGGHIVNGILGPRSFYVSWAALGALAVLAIFYPQWWVLVAVLLLLPGARRRVPLPDSAPLDRRRTLLGLFALAVLVLAFTPRPFIIP